MQLPPYSKSSSSAYACVHTHGYRQLFSTGGATPETKTITQWKMAWAINVLLVFFYFAAKMGEGGGGGGLPSLCLHP